MSSLSAGIPGAREKSVVPARLAAITLCHTIVDFLSYVIVPILTVLEGRLHLTNTQGAVILALGSVSSGLVQPLVALLSDKHDTRVIGTIGMILAAVAVSLTGYATEYWHLVLIQTIGAAGIGAFHPVAAAAMGKMSGARRSLGVSIFFAAGMIGGIGGNWTTPWWTKTFGVESILWFAIPGLLGAVVLAWAIHSIGHNHEQARREHSELPASHRRARWRSVWILYAGNVLRFTANMCLVQLLVRWSEHAAMQRAGVTTLDDAVREASASINGPLQAAMQIGMGVGGLAAGAFLPASREKLALVVVPVIGALGILLYPMADTSAAAFALSVAAGLGYAGVVPTTISLAQRLLPHRTSLASGLMMGGAWGVAAVGPPLAQWLLDTLGISGAFGCVALMLAASGVLALMLPRNLPARG